MKVTSSESCKLIVSNNSHGLLRTHNKCHVHRKDQRVDNANQRYPERKNIICAWNTISCPRLRNKALLLGAETSRWETFDIPAGCLSSLHAIFGQPNATGWRKGPEEEQEEMLNFSSISSLKVGLKTQYKYTQGLTLNGCGTTWKTNHSVFESNLFWIARLPLFQGPCNGDPCKNGHHRWEADIASVLWFQRS